MRRSRRPLVALVALLVVGLLGSSCAGKKAEAPPKPAGVPQDTLVIGVAEDADNLDPAVTVTNNSWAITYPCYQRLMRYKVVDGQGSTEVEGDLAESWEASPDGLVWTFKLKQGFKFDDGTPVDARAVKFTFDRLRKVGKGPFDAFPTLESVEVVGDYAVRFKLNAPFPPFIYSLANNGASIVNPRVMEHEQGGDQGQAYLAEHSMGSGPYRLVEWAKDQYFKLELNPHWTGPKPKFTTVMFKIIKDPSARRLQLERGDLDIAEELPIDQLEELKKNPDIDVREFPSLSVVYVYLNCQRKPLDNVKFRQALSYATDYQGIIKGVMLGKAVQMRGPVPKGMWGHAPDLFQYSLDLEKAKQLLAESGVKTPVALGYLYADRDPTWEPIGLSLQSTFGQLGIKVEMQKLAYATMRDKLDRGDFDLAVGNWTPDFADPYMFMNYWFDSEFFGLAGNRAFYKNPRVDDLIRRAARITDQGEREKLYRQAQDIIIQEAPYLFLFQRNYMVAFRKNVKGYVFQPMLLNIFNTPDMSKE